MKKLLSILVLMSLFFASCEQGGVDKPKGSYAVNGSVQKGPFVQGSSITIQSLDSKLNPSGQVYNTITNDDAGHFALSSVLSSQYSEIVANGYYFDEVEGKLSQGTLTLRSITDLNDGVANVNLLTTLVSQRTIYLVNKKGVSVLDATIQAERELFLSLGIPESDIPDVRFTKMDISQVGDHNALLLAVSVALQYQRTTAELTELISKLAADLADDGALSANMKKSIFINTYNVDLVNKVHDNLVARYNSLGVSNDIPEFEKYLPYFYDFNNDGTGDANEGLVLEDVYLEVNADCCEYILPISYIDDINNLDVVLSEDSADAVEWLTINRYDDSVGFLVDCNISEESRDAVFNITYNGIEEPLVFTLVQNRSYKIEYEYEYDPERYECIMINCICEDNGYEFAIFEENGHGANYYTSAPQEIIQVDGDITSINIPDSVTTIGEYAFYGCESLTSVTIPDSVTTIGNWAFLECTSLTSVNIPDSVTTIGYGAFRNCTSLTSVTIGDSVTEIEISVFEGCYSLTSVTIGDSVTTIGGSAFNQCYSLTSITIPDSVTTIGNYAFTQCYSLTSITIPDGVIRIGDMAFSCCESLTSVNVGDGLKSVGYNPFAGCCSLVEFNGKFAEDNGRILVDYGTLITFAPAGLIEYSIPDSVTKIGDGAFDGCSSLTNINIPNSVTSIGSGAFIGCDSLSSITIPESVKSIGVGVYGGMYIIPVYCKAVTPPSITEPVFPYCTTIYVPMQSVDAYKKAPFWREYTIEGYDF